MEAERLTRIVRGRPRRLGGDPNENTEALKEAGINAYYYISPDTAHEWLTWRRSLDQFAQLLFQEHPMQPTDKQRGWHGCGIFTPLAPSRAGKVVRIKAGDSGRSKIPTAISDWPPGF